MTWWRPSGQPHTHALHSTFPSGSQIVYGLERAVDGTVGKAFPAAAYGATLAFRFANNVIGGENFIDMARWTGIQ